MNFTYEQEVVDRARQLSSDINEYFEEQKYKLFTDEYQMEEISDRYLMNVAIELVISELKDMGIESDLTVDDIIEDHSQLETLFALRTKFDSDNLYQLLQALSTKSFAEFQSVYESIELPEDLLLELAPWLADKFQSDPQWSLIFYAPNQWYSTNYFGEHLTGVMTMLLDKADLNRAVVDDSNIESVNRFLKLMEIRANKVRAWVDVLFTKIEGLDKAKLDDYIENYDIQKLNNDQLPLFAAYNDLKPEKEPEFLIQHHLSVNHHVEYWVDKWKSHKEYDAPMPIYSKEIAVMLVLSLVLDELPGAIMRKKIAPLKDIVSDELYSFTEALTTIDYEKLMKGEQI